MNAMLSVVAGLLLAAGAGAQAQAQSGRMDKAFEAWDTDHNGVLSRAEFEAGWRAVVERGVAARLRAQFEKFMGERESQPVELFEEFMRRQTRSN